MWISKQWNIIYFPKEMKRHGWKINIYYYVKEDNLKRLNELGFQYILCHSKKGKAMEIIKRSGIREKREMNIKKMKDLYGSKTTLCYSIMVDTHHYICANP